MSSRIRIEGHDNLVRDVTSGAVINTSRHEYLQFMQTYNNKMAEKVKVEQMCDELNSLKEEMSDIKHMLKQILEK
jgi:predicted transcriptional regulator